MRLIDADGLIKKAYRSEMWNRSTKAFYLFVVDAEDVEDAPTIDAVEVVRCKDCKYGNPCFGADGKSTDMLCVQPNMFPLRTSPEFYCAHGEKMDAEVEG